MYGLTIGGKHTYDDFGLVMTKCYIPEPAAKINKVNIPYSNGSIDLSEVTGHVNYGDRTGLSFEFVIEDGKYERWPSIMQKLSMHLHGKKLRMIPDNDAAIYYMVRLSVDGDKSNKLWGTITLTGEAEPFKYDITASDEDWLWDPFNFETGIIRNLQDIEIDNGGDVTIIGGGMPSVPEFVVTQSTNLAIVYGGKTYQMPSPGTYRFPAIRVAENDVELTFTGSGELSIRYRGKYL